MKTSHLTSIALMGMACALLTGCPGPDECPDYPNQNPNIDCVDDDGDGYCAVCCATNNPDGSLCQADCDDSDPWTHPGVSDTHADGLDANCDGYDVTPVVETPPEQPPPPENCNNGGVDDDLDGLADCSDPDCAQACLPEHEQSCNLAQSIGQGTYNLNFGDYLDGLSTCGGAERVVRFQNNAPGELVLTLSDTHYVTPMLTCMPHGGTCELVEGATPTSFHIPAGETYFVIESIGNSPNVELTATFTPNTCGDGIINGDEECDDGNGAVGDGCDASCMTEHYYTTCQSAPELTEGVTLVDTVTMGTNMVESSCGAAGEPEYLYVFTPPASGTLTLALENAGPASLYVRNVCTTELYDLSCDVADEASPALLYIPAIENTPLYVFVDGFDLAASGATLTALFNAH